MLGLSGFLHHLPLTGPAGHLLLHPAEDVPGDNSGMAVLHIVYGKLPLILSRLFADAVGDVGLLQKGVANVFFIGQDILNHLPGPSLNSFCRRNFLFCQLTLNVP